MNSFQVFFKDAKGKEYNLITGFNGTIKDAEYYDVGTYFNLGNYDRDLITKGTRVIEAE